MSPDTRSTIQTVTDSLYAERMITEDVLSLSFEPITNSSGTQMNGELTWGVYIYYLKPGFEFRVELTAASSPVPSPTRKHMAIVP